MEPDSKIGPTLRVGHWLAKFANPLVLCFEAALWACAFAAVSELLLARFAAELDWTLPGGSLGIGLSAFSALAFILPALCVAMAALWAVLYEPTTPAEGVRRVYTWLGGLRAPKTEAQRQIQARRVALMGALGVGAALFFLLSMRLIPKSQGVFATDVYTDIFASALAFVAAIAALIVGRLLYRIGVWKLGFAHRLHPLLIALAATGGRFLALGLGGALVLTIVASKLMVTRGLPGLQAFIWVSGLVFAVAFILSALAAERMGRNRAGRLIRVAVGLALWIGCVGGLAWGGNTEAGKSYMANGLSFSAPLVKIGRKVSDLDGDGYSSILGGGDCAPLSGDINPGAREILDNGIDENCRNGDLSEDDLQLPPEDGFVDHELCPSGACDIVFITVDSLRSDYVGAYGADVKTPAIDSLAERGVRFDAGYCIGPGTILTMPQTFTVRWDTQIDLDQSRRKKLGPRPLSGKDRLFVQDLQDLGYQTGAVLGHFYLEGLRYGFQKYDNPKRKWASNKKITSPDITTRARKMVSDMAKKDKPYFLWVHYYDPHHDYLEHRGGPKKSEGSRALYRGEIEYTDKFIKTLIKHVEAQKAKRKRNVIYILTADHGEGLGDHGIKYHNKSFYKELCQVPLIVAGDGIRQGGHEAPVSLHDIGPTTLNLANGKPIEAHEGRSLIRELTSDYKDSERLVFHQAVYVQGGKAHERFGVSGERYRLFWDRLNGTRELYDIQNDPRELKNLVGKESEIADQLMREIEVFLYRVEDPNQDRK